MGMEIMSNMVVGGGDKILWIPARVYSEHLTKPRFVNRNEKGFGTTLGK